MSTSTQPTRATTRGRRPRGEPQPFDFRRQSTLSREHVRTLQIVQETFARGLSTMLASQLRTVVQVGVRSIEQRTYDEYVREIPTPTYLALLSLAPLPGAAILQVPLDGMFCAIELLLGGKGHHVQPRRALTDLELQLTRGLLERGLPDLRDSFEPVVAIEPTIMSQESNPQFAQIAAPTDMTIVVSYDIRIERVAGIATMCIPYSSLQPHLDTLSTTTLFAMQSSADAVNATQRVSEHLARTPVEVTTRFRPVEMSAGDVVRLAVGDIVPLGHPTDQPLVLAVDGVATHAGRVGRRNRRLAVSIDGPIDPADPILRPTRVRVGTSGPRPA